MNLDGLLGTAARLLADALASSGTTVSIERPSGEVASAVVGGIGYAQVATGVPALILPAGLDTLPLTLTGSAPPQPGLMAVLVGPAQDVEVGDVVAVLTSRDPRMTAARYLVQSLEASSAGVVRRAAAVQVAGMGAPVESAVVS